MRRLSKVNNDAALQGMYKIYDNVEKTVNDLEDQRFILKDLLNSAKNPDDEDHANSHFDNLRNGIEIINNQIAKVEEIKQELYRGISELEQFFKN